MADAGDNEDLRKRVRRIEALLRGHTDRRDEAQILNVLGQATGPDLCALLEATDLVWLIGDVDDRVFGPDNRTRLFTLLCEERLDDLSLPVRAALITALQTGRTDSRDERAIERILLGTRGEALTALKNALDSGDDHRDLQHLVWSDVDHDDARDRILEHLAREATTVDCREVKVLSDIDDTFYANWKDERFPKKTVYPGVRQLYVELDRGADPAAGRMGDVAFVTARPGVRTGFVEKLTHRTLRDLGVADPTVLCGSFLHLLSHDSIAEKKLENFIQYAALFPEYGFVFLGDSGQGDAGFGQAMKSREPDRVRAILIHDVINTKAADRQRWAEQGVLFFDTYIGAAQLAHGAGLIQAEGCHRVAEAAFHEMGEIVFSDDDARRARLADLERDAQGLDRP